MSFTHSRCNESSWRRQRMDGLVLEGLEDTFGHFARVAQCGTGLAVTVAKGFNWSLQQNYQKLPANSTAAFFNYPKGHFMF